MTLRLGGHEVRVVNDELEALNMAKSLPHNICGIVLGGAGCIKSLSEKLEVFCRGEVDTPIYLVGMASGGMDRFELENDVKNRLTLSVCNSDALLKLIHCEKGCGGNEQPWRLVL